MNSSILKDYISLTKPGIIFGNAITAFGGFALASRGNIDFLLFVRTLIGLSLIIASACVFNNYIDRGMDEKMARTRNRAFVKGTISTSRALVLAIALLLLGSQMLLLYTNVLTLSCALIGFFIYVIVYSNLKPYTSYVTLVGSIAGGVPPVVGYCAVTNHFDLAALILFMIVVLWQMPHFFAIAMYRFDDYLAASIPVLPIEKGVHTTKVHMLLYVIAFTIMALMLTFFGFMGYVYFSVTVLLGLAWLRLCIQGFKSSNDKLWARKMFLYSLVCITGLCAIIPIDVV